MNKPYRLGKKYCINPNFWTLVSVLCLDVRKRPCSQKTHTDVFTDIKDPHLVQNKIIHVSEYVNTHICMHIHTKQQLGVLCSVLTIF